MSVKTASTFATVQEAIIAKTQRLTLPMVCSGATKCAVLLVTIHASQTSYHGTTATHITALNVTTATTSLDVRA